MEKIFRSDEKSVSQVVEFRRTLVIKKLNHYSWRERELAILKRVLRVKWQWDLVGIPLCHRAMMTWAWKRSFKRFFFFIFLYVTGVQLGWKYFCLRTFKMYGTRRVQGSYDSNV